MIVNKEKQFKQGEILYHAGSFELNMYNIPYDSVAVYGNYGTADERKKCVIPTVCEFECWNYVLPIKNTNDGKAR